MTAEPDHKKYVAALCHMRAGAPQSYDSEHLFAVDNAEAIRKAAEWRVTAAATIDERTWLQVLLDGADFIRKSSKCPDCAIYDTQGTDVDIGTCQHEPTSNRSTAHETSRLSRWPKVACRCWNRRRRFHQYGTSNL